MDCVECSTTDCKESQRRCKAGYGCFSSFKEKQLTKGCVANDYHYNIICTNTAHPVFCCKGNLCNLNVTLPFPDKQPSKSIIRIMQYQSIPHLIPRRNPNLKPFPSPRQTLRVSTCTLDYNPSIAFCLCTIGVNASHDWILCLNICPWTLSVP